MKRLFLTTLAVAMIGISPIHNADACSRVLWNNNGKVVVTGRTMDWYHSFEDMLFVYPRGQKMEGGVDGRVEWMMTNDPPYPFHVENIKRYKDFGGEEALPGTTEADDRFVRTASFLGRLKPPKDAAEALAKILSVIRTVTVPYDADEYGPTWWTSMTDCTNKVWYFDWSQNPNTIWVELKNLNFDEDQPVKVLNPRNPNLAGEVSRGFEPVK